MQWLETGNKYKTKRNRRPRPIDECHYVLHCHIVCKRRLSRLRWANILKNNESQVAWAKIMIIVRWDAIDERLNIIIVRCDRSYTHAQIIRGYRTTKEESKNPSRILQSMKCCFISCTTSLFSCIWKLLIDRQKLCNLSFEWKTGIWH